MTTFGSLARLAAGIGSCLLALSGSAGAQGAAPADPWSRVPALPTSCFKGEATPLNPLARFSGRAAKPDDFEARVRAAEDSNNAAWTRQKAINDSLDARLHQMDMGEKMQRIQAYMTTHPQDAMRAMQAMQAQGASMTAAGTAGQEDLKKLEEELTADTANFRAAAARVRDPIQREMDELLRTKGKVVDEAGGMALPPEDMPRYRALNARLNTDYERMCGAWWGPTGTFPSWLRRYKEYQLKSLVAPGDTAAAGVISMMTMMGVPSTGYRSTAALGAVHDYLYKVNWIYQLRLWRVETE